MKSKLLGAFILTTVLCSSTVFAQNDFTLQAMEEELNRAMKVLGRSKPVSLYFLLYQVWDEHEIYMNASEGALYSYTDEHKRYVDVDVRVGSSKLDNTHEIRGSEYDYLSWIPTIIEIPIDTDPHSLKAVLWTHTDREFKEAQEAYTKVIAEKQVKVAETDTSPDFSLVRSQQYYDPPQTFDTDLQPWQEKLRQLSLRFKEYPWIYNSQVSLRATNLGKYLVNSDGTRIRENRLMYRVSMFASTMADDGMELYLSYSFFATRVGQFPSDSEIMNEIDTLITHLDALRNAPVVEPYIGPAILINRASGVFFHEIFGHRIEGHRQKSEFEGQTFTKKVGEQILPEFISIYDDPTLTLLDEKVLNGHYKFDDEGVPAQKVTVVDHGVLKEFLMSRSPIERFPASNGHGRRSHGKDIVSRQGILYIDSEKEVPFDELRQALIDECKNQGKEYGLIFYDISGGFTSTGRGGTQSFKVIPLFVKRIYVDGRPDEVVRGVDIVGTPLLSFSKIEMTGDDYGIFNGTCGAESGWVPVSAISPSIFVTEIEVEKKAKGQDKPPILPAPHGVDNRRSR